MVRWLWSAAFATVVCASACKRPNPAFGVSDSGRDTDGSTGTTDGSTSGATTDLTGGSSTGVVPECIFEGLGRLTASVKQKGLEVGDCDMPFESWGVLQGVIGDSRGFVPCDDATCMQCGGDAFNLELTGPAGSVPDLVADCTRVRLEREYDNSGGGRCEFTGVVLSAAGGNGVVTPFFIGSSKVISPPGGLTLLSQNLAVTPYVLDQCECPACCAATALQYQLEFVLGSITELLSPADTTLALVSDIEFKVTNLQSHDELVCGAAPAFDWTVVDTAFLN